MNVPPVSSSKKARITVPETSIDCCRARIPTKRKIPKAQVFIVNIFISEKGIYLFSVYIITYSLYERLDNMTPSEAPLQHELLTFLVLPAAVQVGDS